MATLTNQKIKDTYEGLIKTTDNAAITATPKALEDGVGNTVPLEVGTNRINFTNEVDFSAATVSGLAAGGLVNGTGTSSLQSAASLTTTAANAAGNNAIALGNNAQVPGGSDNIAIGNGAQVNATANNSQAFGENAAANSSDATAIGNGTDAGLGGTALGTFAQASGNYSIGVGKNANASAAESIAIGRLAVANNSFGIAIGSNSNAFFTSVALGYSAKCTNSQEAIAIGQTATCTTTRAISIGSQSDATASNAIALGYTAQATASGATALGANVTAAITDTASVKALEVQTDSTPTAGGIIMSDAGGTDRRINIDASGALQIDSTPVGGGAVAQNATRTTLAGPSTTDEIITSITIPAGTYTAGDIVEVWAMYTMDYTGGGTNYIAAQISNSASFNDGTYYSLGAASSGVDAGWILNKHLVINTADGTGLGTDSGAVDSMQDIDATTGSFLYGDNLGKPMDWTSTVYIHFTGFVDNVNSSTTLNAGYAKKVN